jgi:hypothetical protein
MMSESEKWLWLPIVEISRHTADTPDRPPGSAKGLIQIADDFDAPVPDLEQAFEE